jgi:predicted site-specific integrase-resolvase
MDTTTTQRPLAFYTLKDLQDRWRISRRTIYEEIRRGRLHRKLIGGQVRFAAEEIERYERMASG